jgi:hypothetical protein
MAWSLTVTSLLFRSTTNCGYWVYTKFLLTYTAIYRRNRKVPLLGITAAPTSVPLALGHTLYIHLQDGYCSDTSMAKRMNTLYSSWNSTHIQFMTVGLLRPLLPCCQLQPHHILCSKMYRGITITFNVMCWYICASVYRNKNHMQQLRHVTKYCTTVVHDVLSYIIESNPHLSFNRPLPTGRLIE